MPNHFTLFGRTLALDAGTTQITPSGAFDAVGSITLKPGNIMVILLDGQICGVTLSLHASFSY